LPKTFLRKNGKSIASHNDPYPSALSTEETPGLNKIRKITNDHLHRTPQGPQDKASTLAQFQCSSEAAQQSSSPNLIRKVQDWRDWTYTDGSFKKHEEGQDTGSGVYHPCFNVSHYVNPSKRRRYNQCHLTCRASSHSSRNHPRLLP